MTVVRLFRNGDVWQESTRYGRDDLPLVSKVTDLAHSWIYQCTMDHPQNENGAASSASKDTVART